MSRSALAAKQCRELPKGTAALESQQVSQMLSQLTDWEYSDGQIHKTFSFKNYYETMAFVNATAWISNQQDHHPDLIVGYNKCDVRYSTHSVGGLSENDFICAAKVEQLLPQDG